MKIETLRIGRGDSQEVCVTFGALRPNAVIERLVQVSRALEDAYRAGPGSVARLVTKVETNFAEGSIVVRAVVPESTTAENLQRELLGMVPPA